MWYDINVSPNRGWSGCGFTAATWKGKGSAVMIFPATHSPLVHRTALFPDIVRQCDEERKKDLVQTRHLCLERCGSRKNEFIRLSWIYPLLHRCIRTTIEVGLRLQPSFTATIPSDRPPLDQLRGFSWCQSFRLWDPQPNQEGGWILKTKGGKSEEENRVMMEWKRNAYKEGD